ncbi:MAG: hypothetical protein Tsb0015_16270 [Simkaniaceae bacterium]
MNKLKFFYVLLFSFLSLNVSAATIHLINDSSYTLNAVIKGADGQILGEFTIYSQRQATWQDSDQGIGEFTKGPYTVEWTCQHGSPFGVNYQVSSYATVTALGSVGRGYCKDAKQNGQGLEEY